MTTLSLAGHESPSTLCVTSNLKNQPISTILESETLEHLAPWQNIHLVSVHGPIVNAPFSIELTMEQQAHALHLKTQLITNGS